MAKIHVLDEHIANQIAAGEVVERPASVVKELLENSVDAGATKIEVTVEEGGLLSIRVKDNGSGIEAEDMETAFYRHATSKIAQGRDLFQITSLGFRGEALASIAAVSKVEVLSASGNDGRGRRIVIEGGKLCSHEDATSPQGTEFAVKELFFNTPARLKYMKTIQTELGHISDVLYRMAMSHPNISFRLRHNENVLLQTLGNGDLLQVVAAIYGTSAAKAMLPIQGENLDYRVSGLISLPEWTRANRGGMSTIVNGRYIRNYGLNQAILKAYHTLLPINRYPLVVVQLEMHPSLVDVNVHPAKLEVRFSKEAELYEFVETTLRGILRQEVLIPQVTKQQIRRGDNSSFIQEQFLFPRGPLKDESESAGYGQQGPLGKQHELGKLTPEDDDLDAPADVQSGSDGNGVGQMLPLPEAPPEIPPSYDPFGMLSGESGSNVLKHNYSDNENSHRGPASAVNGNNGAAEDRASQDAAPSAEDNGSSAPVSQGAASAYRSHSVNSPVREGRSSYNPSAQVAKGERSWKAASLPDPARLASAVKSDVSMPAFPELSLIGQHHGTYLIAQNQDGLYLIDQHAAHERVNYEYYYEQFGNPAQASQELLLPITLEFTPSETEKLKTRLAWFEQAGVYLEHFGGQTFRVRSHPFWFPKGDEKDIIEEMSEWVLSERSIDVAKMREAASIMCSCKASIKANQKLTDQEAEVLIQRLGSCRQPYTCPHGRPIVVSFSTYDLEKLFKRVM
ncbi:MAG TPA: DNA mismatch repair endonuclease MutL [Paenibacillus sp.]|uniref:DNA mismatch repair endonuclease MutL n=1 Tax=Paenibacillus TaxID=44249 RepID=UPI000BA0BF74|nr:MULTISPECIES: DNA mismatch repair endonuclease MutL [Paenibacillus]OZQ71609.1 DNA mismatch repair protein MutL [Paenibacillus taichungensis]HBU83012.1 DNA mismatch repair endonuclease MutL [Paenibacillus sp.]